MALKDLIASKGALTENAIESLIKNYARYDLDEKEVTFLPAAAALSAKQKVLVYLVGLQGWPFVAKGEDVPTAAKPAAIGERVGVHGGTLRPLLKELKDGHVIAWKGGAYSVRASSIAEIKALLEGKAPAAKPPKPKRAHKQPGKPTGGEPKPRRAPAAGKDGDIAARFNGWIKDGFFRKARTLSEVRDRFHEQGVILPRSSIPHYLLTAIRAEPPRLVRSKGEVGGKKVWVYTSPS
jgi:hypothetical protein